MDRRMSQFDNGYSGGITNPERIQNDPDWMIYTRMVANAVLLAPDILGAIPGVNIPAAVVDVPADVVQAVVGARRFIGYFLNYIPFLGTLQRKFIPDLLPDVNPGLVVLGELPEVPTGTMFPSYLMDGGRQLYIDFMELRRRKTLKNQNNSYDYGYSDRGYSPRRGSARSRDDIWD